MHKKTAAIIQVFPDFEEKIDFLFLNDENFRDLCSDYMLCVSMLVVRKKEINKNKEEIAEFKDLKQHLESEILNEITTP